MIWLILNIVFSGILYVIFSYFPKYKVDNMVAVIVNYLTATICGIILMDAGLSETFSRPWFPIAFCMGILFIFIFLLMASSSQINGISITSVANKMSLIIPVIAGVFLYDENLNTLIIIGIILALISVYLTSKKEESNRISTNGMVLLIILFFGSGLIDTLVKYMQQTQLNSSENAAFVMVIFLSAAFFGIIWMLIARRDKFRNFNKVSIVGGIVLGVPNFCSIYFLVMALENSGLQSSVLYPVNNMGIVAFSALMGLFIFREKISFINAMGILTALVAIALIAFG